jgi:hypothetical protein
VPPLRPERADFLGNLLLHRVPPDAPPVILRWRGTEIALPWAGSVADLLRSFLGWAEAVLARRPGQHGLHTWVLDADVHLAFPTPDTIETTIRFNQVRGAAPQSGTVTLPRGVVIRDLLALFDAIVAIADGHTADPLLGRLRAAVEGLRQAQS